VRDDDDVKDDKDKDDKDNDDERESYLGERKISFV